MSKLYPAQLICEGIALLFLLCVGAAWAAAEEGTVKDLSYLVLTGLIAASMFFNCEGEDDYTQMLGNAGVFVVAFLVYSAAGSASTEQVLLCPAVSVCLIDLIFAIQAVR